MNPNPDKIDDAVRALLHLPRCGERQSVLSLAGKGPDGDALARLPAALDGISHPVGRATSVVSLTTAARQAGEWLARLFVAAGAPNGGPQSPI